MTNFHHSGGNISFQGSSAKHDGGAVLESSSGVAGDASGCLWCNCSPLDTLLVKLYRVTCGSHKSHKSMYSLNL